MAVDPALLAEIELFQALPPEAVQRVAEAASVQSLARGDVIFGQGDPAEALYVVRGGRILIGTKAPDGRESVVALMESGDLFGEMSLFDGMGRSAEARSVEPSQVVVVPFAPLREALDEQPRALWKVVQLLARRLRVTDEALADTFFLDVPGRTAKRLLELAGDADEFVLPLTQEELSRMVGASRERVNKAIAAFVRLGWIEQSDRRYRILDRQQLSRRSR